MSILSARSYSVDNKGIAAGVSRLPNIDLSKSVQFHHDISVRRHDRILKVK